MSAFVIWQKSKSKGIPVRAGLADVQEAVKTIESATVETKGSTYSLHFGNQAEARLYAVALFPNLSWRVPPEFDLKNALRVFINTNSKLLTTPGLAIGTWLSGDHVIVDICALVARKSDAIALGKYYNQEAVCRLFDLEIFQTGGDDSPRPHWPIDQHRLPEFLKH
jgi:hypothetical protein